MLVVCDAGSHRSEVKIATFAEARDETGRRVAVNPVMHDRTSRDGRTIFVSIFDPSAPVGDEDWREWSEVEPESVSPDIMRSTRPSPITQTVLPDEHFHYQLRCWRCGLNLSVRYETLAGPLGKLIDAGVSRVSLAVLSRTVGS